MKQLSEMSVEKLQKQAKTIKVVTGTLVGMLLALLGFTVFLSVKKGFNALTIIPFSLLPIVLLNLNTLKQIQKELDSRKDAF